MLRSKYWKSAIPAIATVLALIFPLALGTESHSGQDWINVIILAFGTILAWTSANLSEGIARFTKEIVGALTAGLVLLSSLLAGGVTRNEWMQVIVAIVMALLLPLKGNDGYVHPVMPTQPEGDGRQVPKQ